MWQITGMRSFTSIYAIPYPKEIFPQNTLWVNTWYAGEPVMIPDRITLTTFAVYKYIVTISLSKYIFCI